MKTGREKIRPFRGAIFTIHIRAFQMRLKYLDTTQQTLKTLLDLLEQESRLSRRETYQNQRSDVQDDILERKKIVFQNTMVQNQWKIKKI